MSGEVTPLAGYLLFSALLFSIGLAGALAWRGPQRVLRAFSTIGP